MKSLTLKDVSTLCSGLQYAQGFRHVKDGDLLTPWVGDQTIGGQVRNRVRPHTVRVRFRADGQTLPTCTCGSHARRRFCQHVAALLIAWATDADSFVRYRGADTAPLVEGAAPREEQDPLVAFGMALVKVESLLLDLLSHGLMTLNTGRVEFIRETERLAGTYGLGHIAIALGQISEQVGLLRQSAKAKRRLRRDFDEARYAQALSTAWHLTQVAKQALEEGDLARLREIASLDLADAPAEILESVELVELGSRLSRQRKTSSVSRYLLDLDAGRVLAQRMPPPRPRRGRPSRIAARPMMRGRVAVYPASDVDEVVLLDVGEVEPPGPDSWQRALDWAVTSSESLVAQLREVVVRLPGSEAAHVWFAPSQVVVRSDGVSFLDDTGASVEVTTGPAIGRVLLDEPILAAFGEVGRTSTGLRFQPLSLLSWGDAPELIALRG